MKYFYLLYILIGNRKYGKLLIITVLSIIKHDTCLLTVFARGYYVLIRKISLFVNAVLLDVNGYFGISNTLNS